MIHINTTTEEDLKWAVIERLNWINVKSSDEINDISEFLKNNYDEKIISNVAEFAKLKRKELSEILTKYEKQINVRNFYNVSDDGFWDLTAHVVGLGKDFYHLVLMKPEIARTVNAVENFEYIFTKALK